MGDDTIESRRRAVVIDRFTKLGAELDFDSLYALTDEQLEWAGRRFRDMDDEYGQAVAFGYTAQRNGIPTAFLSIVGEEDTWEWYLTGDKASWVKQLGELEITLRRVLDWEEGC